MKVFMTMSHQKGMHETKQKPKDALSCLLP